MQTEVRLQPVTPLRTQRTLRESAPVYISVHEHRTHNDYTNTPQFRRKATGTVIVVISEEGQNEPKRKPKPAP